MAYQVGMIHRFLKIILKVKRSKENLALKKLKKEVMNMRGKAIQQARSIVKWMNK